MPTLVATKTSPDFAPRSAAPRMRSDAPSLYEFAVSNVRTPRASARSMIRRASASGVRLPKFMQPSVTRTDPWLRRAVHGDGDDIGACITQSGLRRERREILDAEALLDGVDLRDGVLEAVLAERLMLASLEVLAQRVVLLRAHELVQ